MRGVPAGHSDAGLKKRGGLAVKLTHRVKADLIAHIAVRLVRRGVVDRQVQEQDFVSFGAAKGVLGVAKLERKAGLGAERVELALHLVKNRLGPRCHLRRGILFGKEGSQDAPRLNEVALAQLHIRQQHLGKLRARIDQQNALQRRRGTVEIIRCHLFLKQGEVQFKVRRIFKHQINQRRRPAIRRGRRRCL